MIATDFAPLYEATADGIFLVKETIRGRERIQLSNFVATIVEEKIHDDGCNQKRIFVIEGRLSNGKALPQLNISAESYGSMRWVGEYGASAIVYPRRAEQLQVAVKVLSKNVRQRHVFANLGWKNINGKDIYLHGSGAIDESGAVPEVLVELNGDRFQLYGLPQPPSGQALVKSFLASLSILQLGPKPLMYAVLGGIYCAPLGEIIVPDYVLWLEGFTGGHKSGITAIAQAHFGRFDERHLPGSWSSTANRLEEQAFIAKDSLLVVDDYAPDGNRNAIDRQHEKSARLIRSVGNHDGRGRMKGPTYYPRGLILSSGEHPPKGASIQARLLTLEVAPGDVNVEELTRLQGLAKDDAFSLSMAGYIQHLAKNMNTLKTVLPERRAELRQRLAGEGGHKRTPGIVAGVLVGLEAMLEFGVGISAIGQEEREHHLEQARVALSELAQKQSLELHDEDVVTKFIRLLTAVLVSGQAHIADAYTGGAPLNARGWGWREKGTILVAGSNDSQPLWEPRGPTIGWMNGSEVLLNPEAALAAAQTLASRQGDHLPVSAVVLCKRMKQKGMLITNASERKNVVKRTVGGELRYLMAMPISVMTPLSEPQAESCYESELSPDIPASSNKLDVPNVFGIRAAQREQGGSKDDQIEFIQGGRKL